MSTADNAPLIVHLIHRLDIGGLENGLVNLINNLPPERYRHAIVCLESAGDFRLRIRRPDVEIISLNKRQGKDWRHYLSLFQTLRRLRPYLIHTRNLPGIEAQLLAAIAGVRLRVHGEHGRDIADLQGTRPRYRMLRRLLAPLIGHFITVSKELETWLVSAIGVRPQRISHICNGVDSVRFRPHRGPPCTIGPAGFADENTFIIGSVGRMAEVKDHMTLVRAFLILISHGGLAPQRLRLVIAGDGPCRQHCLEMLHAAGANNLAWLPGARDDIPQLMRSMTIFVQPSLTEGASNTVLEAMASGLPVVATNVGGNPELVQNDRTGMLIPPNDPAQLAYAIDQYYRAPSLAAQHGARARRRVLSEFSLAAMADAYQAVYDRLIQQPMMKG
ncbi:TIGR03088 family PEP-CTERM/XrtA system glycosyltransferase [Duganella sp. sic0402]|uniref:TIGR03088 family PEP-CTERM/XrtA system glycosyltransferase n=1 Tax=Duganella sp. sic0402 TaxID=2854786 RepID=UPI001C480310|nr:TIGR03088 family PEP-CTERM/XrtA system glycosyltransferase [Duganella sp. sic0402]MBV7534761.1 TIGR03088 family PEP-CTERM/XrtA system glycosyltransferase [Duganella sp. sic0402]